MNAIEELATQVGTAAACRSLGVPRATLYRHRQPKPIEPATATRPAPPRALCEQERQQLLDVLDSEPFADKAPADGPEPRMLQLPRDTNFVPQLSQTH
jgi:hypothetical protein